MTFWLTRAFSAVRLSNPMDRNRSKGFASPSSTTILARALRCCFYPMPKGGRRGRECEVRHPGRGFRHNKDRSFLDSNQNQGYLWNPKTDVGKAQLSDISQGPSLSSLTSYLLLENPLFHQSTCKRIEEAGPGQTNLRSPRLPISRPLADLHVGPACAATDVKKDE